MSNMFTKPVSTPRYHHVVLSVLLTLAFTFTFSLPVRAADTAKESAKPNTAHSPPTQSDKQKTKQPASQEKTATDQKVAAADEPQQAPVIGWLDIDQPLREGPSPFAWVSEEEAGLSLSRAVAAIDRVANDPKMSGLVISLNSPEFSLVQVDRLAEAVARVRAKGKKVMTFGESYDMSSYMLAATADQILLQHKGMVELHGLGVEEMYFANLLEKVGAKADFLQVGKFKGAEEPLTRTGPSEEWSKNFDALLDDMYRQIIDRIGKGRNLSKAQIEQLFIDVWSLSDEQLVERKVVDQLSDRDLMEATSAAWGDDFTWVDLADPVTNQRPQNPLAMMSMLFQEREVRIKKPTIATIWAQGEITSGESAAHSPSGPSNAAGPSAGLLGGTNIGSKTVVQALEEARDNPMVKGVVLFIDSPGGSALASELMWQSVRDLSDYKPVYVVIGSMAASGGYYMACAADQIYVSPGSILGSIGVVGGKIVLGDLYEKLGIAVNRRSRGPMGGMFNSVEPFTPLQRKALQNAFEHTYEQFLDRVTTGRGDRLPDVKKVAEGRLFTGTQSVANGMADKMGGMDLAITELAAALDLEPGKYDVVSLPAPMNLGDFLNNTFGGLAAPNVKASMDLSALAAVKQLMGPQAWRAARPIFSGLLLMQKEPILTLMPTAIVFR